MRLKPLGVTEGASLLESVRSLAKSLGADVKNPKWTSYGALEVDVFARSREDFALFSAALEPLSSLEFSRDLNVAPTFRPPSEVVSEARIFFNSERYWEAHEALESVWREAAGDEKLYLQGVILVCAAFVHHQKKEEGVALGVLARAAPQLGRRGGDYYGIDTESLRAQVTEMLRSRRLLPFKL
jgi:uncharacterized protein